MGTGVAPSALPPHEIVRMIFSASLTLMALLLAVSAIVLSEYLKVKESPLPIWRPHRTMLVGTLFVLVLTGLTSLLCLFYLLGYPIPSTVILTLCVFLIATVMIGFPVVIVYFLS